MAPEISKIAEGAREVAAKERRPSRVPIAWPMWSSGMSRSARSCWHAGRVGGSTSQISGNGRPHYTVL